MDGLRVFVAGVSGVTVVTPATGMWFLEAPGPGSKVRDRHGCVWVNTADEEMQGGSDWELEEAMGLSFEPESWTRVCEFGPLTVIH